MSNPLTMWGLLVYIIGITVAISMISGGSIDTSAIGIYTPSSNFLVDGGQYLFHQTSYEGKFNTSIERGLYAEELNYDLIFNPNAECSFGSIPIVNKSKIAFTLWLSGMIQNSEDELWVQLIHTTDEINGELPDRYYWLHFENGNINPVKVSYSSLPPFNMFPTYNWYPAIGHYNSDEFNMSVNYNFNTNLLDVWIDNHIVGTQSIDIPCSDITSGSIKSMPFYIKVNNQDMSIKGCNQVLKAAKQSTSWEDYVGMFWGILVWGIPDSMLSWYWHIMLITIPELVFAFLLVTNIIRGD